LVASATRKAARVEEEEEVEVGVAEEGGSSLSIPSFPQISTN